MINIKKKLSILVPLYNEQSCINEFFRRIVTVTDKIHDKYDINIYFLNNCSTDKSLNLIKELKSDTLKIKYITYSKNIFIGSL